MKLYPVPMLCIALLFSGCGESAQRPTVDAEIFKTANTVESKVEGMDCGGCESSICAAVQDVPGVAAVKADRKSGTVTVALADGADAGVTRAEVEKVIAGLSGGKYTIGDVNDSTPEEEDAAKPTDDPASNAPASDEQAGAESKGTFVFASYTVTGMDCSGCSSQIVSAVQQVDGVQKVEADHTSGSVRVTFDDRFDEKVKTDEIKNLIAGLSNGKYTVSY